MGHDAGLVDYSIGGADYIYTNNALNNAMKLNCLRCLGFKFNTAKHGHQTFLLLFFNILHFSYCVATVS